MYLVQCSKTSHLHKSTNEINNTHTNGISENLVPTLRASRSSAKENPFIEKI